MTRTPADIDRAVQRVSRTRLDPRETRTQARVDLSPAAIAARQAAELRDGNLTGAQLIERAKRVYERSTQLAKTALHRPPGRKREKASAKADEALVTAAVQVRIAELTPLDKPYLHALDLEQIQVVQAEVKRAAGVDIAALAVDTHRRLISQRNRIKAERGAR